MNQLHLTNFDIHRDSRGVLTAILNVANRSMNVIDESVLHDLDELLLAVEQDQQVPDIVFSGGQYPMLTAVAAGLARQPEIGFFVEPDESAWLNSTESDGSLHGRDVQHERDRKPVTSIQTAFAKPRRIQTIGISGSGVIGAGIAYWASTRGFDVVLKDDNSDQLGACLSHILKMFEESAATSSLAASDTAARYGTIIATTDWESFADSDVVIEAASD